MRMGYLYSHFNFIIQEHFAFFPRGVHPWALVFRFDYLRLCEKKNLINFMQSWS